MCGINGIFNLNGNGPISLENLQRMTAMLRHRGPDESGFYLDDRIGMGHARLSIIDLARGTQPIHNEDETLWIVYNGEVFNYVELRESLEKKGHRFYTTSDTEVILHLFEEKGIECLSDLNGQFALAIWNSKKAELFLARDRFGIRPLYYTVDKERLVFASEIKSIFSCRQISRQIDPVALDQIFTFWTTLPGQTVFKNVFELPPGCCLTAVDGKINIQPYWEIPFVPSDEQTTMPFGELVECLRDLLQDAIRIRLRADVPVGSYLSGGLDSSGITAMISRRFNHQLKTFGIRFEEDRFDEGDYQQQIASFLQVDHHELAATNEQIGSAFADVIWHCEKALLRTSPIPLYLLSRQVRDHHLKVVLTGEGADEVFGGYNIFKEAKVRRHLARFPDSPRRINLIDQLYPYVISDPRARRSLQAFFRQGLDGVNDPLFSHLRRWENTARAKMFFSNDLKTALNGYSGYEQLTKKLPADYHRLDFFARAQYLEMSLFLSNYLLSSQGDRVAMAHSVEIRLPYLDPRVVEFMARVPAKWKILGMQEKYILKKTWRQLLPDNITSRPKHPYRAPIKQSLINENASNDFINGFLSEKTLNRTGYFDSGKVQKLLSKIQKSKINNEMDDMALAGILSTQMLVHQFIEDNSHFTAAAVSPDLVIDKRTASASKS